MTVPFSLAGLQARTGIWVLLGLLSIFCLPSLSVAEVSKPQETEAESWLRKMADARRTQSYEGVFVDGRGDEVSFIQIPHRYKDGRGQERLVYLDGERRDTMREGKRVYSLLPGKEVIHLEQSLPSGPFSSFDGSHPFTSSDQYHMTRAGAGRVAD